MPVAELAIIWKSERSSHEQKKHKNVHRVKARNTRNQKAPVMKFNALRIGKHTIINVGHHKPAEHEKHVNSEVPFTDEMGEVGHIQAWETLNAIMIQYDPKRSEPAQ